MDTPRVSRKGCFCLHPFEAEYGKTVVSGVKANQKDLRLGVRKEQRLGDFKKGKFVKPLKYDLWDSLRIWDGEFFGFFSDCLGFHVFFLFWLSFLFLFLSLLFWCLVFF